jgi:hypothetical protein
MNISPLERYRSLPCEKHQFLARVIGDPLLRFGTAAELLLYLIGLNPDFPDGLQRGARARILEHAAESNVRLEELEAA